MINIVLVEPEIPSNTGNIVRTCVATGSVLHLIRPLGFSTDDKMLKRAGLDYWYDAEIHYYDSFEELRQKYADKVFYFFSTKGQRVYADANFEEDCFLVFGKETKGLDEQLLHDNYQQTLRVPMKGDTRSLNLSNTAAVAVYEILRQKNFAGLQEAGDLTRFSWDTP